MSWQVVAWGLGAVAVALSVYVRALNQTIREQRIEMRRLYTELYRLDNLLALRTRRARKVGAAHPIL